MKLYSSGNDYAAETAKNISQRVQPESEKSAIPRDYRHCQRSSKPNILVDARSSQVCSCVGHIRERFVVAKK